MNGQSWFQQYVERPITRLPAVSPWLFLLWLVLSLLLLVNSAREQNLFTVAAFSSLYLLTAATSIAVSLYATNSDEGWQQLRKDAMAAFLNSLVFAFLARLPEAAAGLLNGWISIDARFFSFLLIPATLLFAVILAQLLLLVVGALTQL